MATDTELAEMIARARADRPRAGEPTIREQLKAAGLTASTDRLRAALRAQPTGALAPAAHDPGPRPQDGPDAGPGAEVAVEAAGPVGQALTVGAGGDHA